MRKVIREMIIESILKETRLQKKDFAMFKKGVPSIDQAYYVHWVPQNIYGGNLPNLHFSDLIPIIKNLMKKESSFNLVDPSGQTTIPYYDTWGPVGIIVQGVVTYGGTRDLGSTRDKTASGERYRPSEIDSRGRLIPGKRFSPSEDFKKALFDDDGRYLGDEPYDIEPNTFLSHIPDFPYSGSEFIVKPQVLSGIVLHTQSEYPDVYHDSAGDPGTLDEYTDAENIAKIKSIAQQLGVPLAVGHNQIGDLYRYLYSNNPRVN
jgi:hypothetical protein